MKSVQKKTHKICGISQGSFSGYFPLFFTDLHYSMISATFHSVILDYKLRELSLDMQNPLISAEPVVNIVKIGNKENENRKKISEKMPIKVKDLTHYWFLSNDGKLPIKIKSEQIDIIYNEYYGLLQKMYGTLKYKFDLYFPNPLLALLNTENIAPPTLPLVFSYQNPLKLGCYNTKKSKRFNKIYNKKA